MLVDAAMIEGQESLSCSDSSHGTVRSGGGETVFRGSLIYIPVTVCYLFTLHEHLKGMKISHRPNMP